MVLSLAWISRSVFFDASQLEMATRLSPCWKTLMGGKAPVPAVAPRSQSLSRRDLERPLQIEQRVKRMVHVYLLARREARGAPICAPPLLPQ